MQIISSQQIKGTSKKPKMLMKKLENLNIALTFIQNQGIRLLNVGSSDINEGNMVPILGMIWMLILRYQINKKVHNDQKGGSGKNALLKWVNKNVSASGLVVKNFTKSFQDPKLISLLVNKFLPGAIDIDTLTGDLENIDQVYTFISIYLPIYMYT